MLGARLPGHRARHLRVWGGRDLRPAVSCPHAAVGRGLPPPRGAHLACGPAERPHLLMFHVLLLLACAVAIYVACEWFVNAVEWLGVRLEVGPVAVGTILAAAGTALPESVVTLVAVLFGSHEHGNDIAVGAAMGGPLVVGTIAYGVTGGMLIWRKRRQRAALTAAASPRGAGAADLGGGSLALATDDRGDHPAGRNPSGDD